MSRGEPPQSWEKEWRLEEPEPHEPPIREELDQPERLQDEVLVELPRHRPPLHPAAMERPHDVPHRQPAHEHLLRDRREDCPEEQAGERDRRPLAIELA